MEDPEDPIDKQKRPEKSIEKFVSPSKTKMEADDKKDDIFLRNPSSGELKDRKNIFEKGQKSRNEIPIYDDIPIKKQYRINENYKRPESRESRRSRSVQLRPKVRRKTTEKKPKQVIKPLRPIEKIKRRPSSRASSLYRQEPPDHISDYSEPPQPQRRAIP